MATERKKNEFSAFLQRELETRGKICGLAIILTEEDVQQFLREGYYEFRNYAETIEGYLHLSKPCVYCGTHCITIRGKEEQYICWKCWELKRDPNITIDLLRHKGEKNGSY